MRTLLAGIAFLVFINNSFALDFLALSQECAPLVAPKTMAAIIKTESGFNPLSIGINSGARLVRQPENKSEAVATAKWLIENGYNIDLGMGQVNSSNLAKIGLRVEDAFDSCKNLAAAAMILLANFQSARGRGHDEQAALRMALSAYNTGSSTKGFSNGYVQKVINNAEAVVPNISSKAVMPIPVDEARMVKSTVKLRTYGLVQKSKLKADNKQEAISDGSNVTVYSANTNSEMVFSSLFN